MKSIMIIDDEKNILTEVKKILEEDNFNVKTAKNSKEAFELMNHETSDNIDLMLIDTSIPNSNIPAFFSMKPSSKKNIDTTKNEDFLQKPFTKEQLIKFVKKKL